MSTLFLNPPSFHGFDGGAGSRYQTKEEAFAAVETFYRRFYLRPRPILRILRTMLEDKSVFVRRVREGYEFFRTMADRRRAR